MKHFIFAAAVAGMVGVMSVAPARRSPVRRSASVTISKKVMADGKPLPTGTYQLRLTNDTPKPGVGQSPDGERYVEFVRERKVVAREVATVVSSADIGTDRQGSENRPRAERASRCSRATTSCGSGSTGPARTT